MYICTHKLESEFLGRVSTTSGADDTTLTAESEEELKSLLMRVKSWLKTHHSKNEDCGLEFHHFMAIDGEKVETVTDSFLGPQNHCGQ